MRAVLNAVCCMIVFNTPTLAQIDNGRDPPKTGDGTENRQVKGRAIFGEGSRGHWGKVVKIDETEMHIRCVYSGDDTPKVRVFRPIDVLANGKVLDGMPGASYRWQDIQKGDTVTVDIVRDVDEKIDYVVSIRLDLRPGGKIPEPQNMKDGETHYLRANVRNDIENGLDVSEEEIQKAFPYKPNPFAPLPAGVTPPTDRLPDDYCKKLSDIRAKKEKEHGLKAKPLADKTDPKKDDKK